MTTITLSSDLPRGVYTLVPVASVPPPVPAELFATSFLSPAAFGPITNGMMPITGLSALPWGSPPLAIQCLGPPSEHQHAIVPVASTGGAALRLRMLAGSGSDQAALIVQPRQPVSSFYTRARIMLDAKLATILTPANNWTMVQEWKTGGFPPAPYGGDLRAMLQVQMDPAGKLHWRAEIDTNANDPSVELRTLYDSGYTSGLPVMAGLWQTVELFCRRSAGNDGLIWWRVGGVEVGRFAGPNMGAHGDPINRLMITNLYGAAWPQERFITDLSIAAAPP